jgi:hypothetical protein
MRRIAMAVVDFPHPLSPTRLKVSPRLAVEGDAVHRPHRANLTLADHALGHREVDLEALHRQAARQRRPR